MSSRTARWSLLALAVLAAGCGDTGPKLVPASGVVLIDGKPLTHGSIMVAPKNARAAIGKIGSDGRFTLTTNKDNDGCYVGTHAVSVTGTETTSPSSQRWHAPEKYSNLSESGLKVTIDGPTESLKIELTWAGGKPHVQHFGSSKE